MSGAAGASGGYSGSNYGGRGGGAPPTRTFEERAQAKEQMMQSVRDSSQQDRRVYVGNLSYDVKWHHLKDFMRQGQSQLVEVCTILADSSAFSWRGSLRRRVVTSEWNVEGGRQCVDVAGLFLVIVGRWIDGLDCWSAGYVGMRVSHTVEVLSV